MALFDRRNAGVRSAGLREGIASSLTQAALVRLPRRVAAETPARGDFQARADRPAPARVRSHGPKGDVRRGQHVWFSSTRAWDRRIERIAPARGFANESVLRPFLGFRSKISTSRNHSAGKNLAQPMSALQKLKRRVMQQPTIRAVVDAAQLDAALRNTQPDVGSSTAQRQHAVCRSA